MKCKDLEGLLLTYANGELRGTLKEFIEYHLSECANCRLSLSKYQKARERLLALRQTPEIPVSKQAIMTQIKAGTGVRRWLRPVTIAVPVLLIVAVTLSLQFTGVFSNNNSILSKAYAASSELESFRYIKEEYTQESPEAEPVNNYLAEIAYKSPDNYHFISESLVNDTISGSPSRIETIRIGDQVYVNLPVVITKLEDEWFRDMVMSEQKTLELLNLLVKAETLDDELLDNVECYHFFGNVDMDKLLTSRRTQQERMYYRMDKSLPYGMTTDLETYIENSNASYRTQDITFEFWIGKDDYLIRKGIITYTTREGETSTWNRYKSTGILRYFAFNEDVTIEVPLDDNGKLLAGWSTYTIEPLVIPEKTATEKTVSSRPSTGIDGLPDFIDPDFESPFVLQSYKATGETWEYVNGKFVNSVNSELIYSGYNHLHSIIKYTEEYAAVHPLPGSSIETIVSGNKAYTNMSTPIASSSDFDESMTAKDTIRQIDQLYSIEILPEEEINGTLCYHIRGILDTEMYLEWYYPEWEKSFEIMNELSDGILDSEEGWETIQKITRSQEVVYDYWFGKEDYLLRKKIRLERALLADLPPLDDTSHESTRQITHEYTDFNEAITIEEPLDDSGNLLDGWVVSTLE